MLQLSHRLLALADTAMAIIQLALNDLEQFRNEAVFYRSPWMVVVAWTFCTMFRLRQTMWTDWSLAFDAVVQTCVLINDFATISTEIQFGSHVMWWELRDARVNLMSKAKRISTESSAIQTTKYTLHRSQMQKVLSHGITSYVTDFLPTALITDNYWHCLPTWSTVGGHQKHLQCQYDVATSGIMSFRIGKCYCSEKYHYCR